MSKEIETKLPVGQPRLVRLLGSWKTKAAMASLNAASMLMFWSAAIRHNDLWTLCAPAGAITAMMAGIYAGAAVRKFRETNASLSHGDESAR